MPILVTGAAGFIGFHLAFRLLEQGRQVLALDNLNDYYDVTLKQARLRELERFGGFRFVRMDLADQSGIDSLFAAEGFKTVVNLAAQAGVRHSLINPQAYVRSNIEGFVNILEACRHHGVAHLVYASSSSVYGAATTLPFSTHRNTDHPVSLYGASKKANELLAHSYSHLFGLPTTGLRFFTVYGPWGRPDMALSLFTRAILDGAPIQLFNHGHMRRDFTYVDDAIAAVCRVLDRVATPNAAWRGDDPDPASSAAPYRLYNIGSHRAESLMRLVEILEQCIGRKAARELLPMQAGDVPATFADVDDLARDIGFAPATPLEVGIERFVRWYRDFYRV